MIPARHRSPSIAAVGLAGLIPLWVGAVLLAAPRLGLYYETLAAWCVVPPLGLNYAYCASHRRRDSALLAVVATLVAGLVMALAIVIPKATAV